MDIEMKSGRLREGSGAEKAKNKQAALIAGGEDSTNQSQHSHMPHCITHGRQVLSELGQ